jgi:hypothetical protein
MRMFQISPCRSATNDVVLCSKCVLFEMAQRGLGDGGPWILSCECRRLFRAPCSSAMRAHMTVVVVGRVQMCVTL